MYCSLSRVDLVLAPDEDGRRRYVQTDHRPASEVEESPELSAMFALVRVRNPKRVTEPGEPEPDVLYAATVRPPDFLRRVVHAAGASLYVGDDFEFDPPEGEPEPLDDVIARVFADLARAVAVEFGVPFSIEGLATVEEILAASAGTLESNETRYWMAVVKLGCFAGELIRESNGGFWEIVDTGLLPFALATTFRDEEASVNPLGKAMKRFANGEEDSTVELVRMVRGPR